MNSSHKHIFNKWLKIFLISELLIFVGSLLIYLYLDKYGLLFQFPEALYVLLCLPFIYFLFFRRLIKKLYVFTLMPHVVNSKTGGYFIIFNLKFIFLKNTLIALIIALSSPIYGTRKVDVISKEGELMICLDISNSMNVMDIDDESRLNVSKRLLNRIVNKLNGQKIGICLFAADGFVQIPPTNDYESVKFLLSDVKTTFLSRQGTDVSNALVLAVNSFSKGKTPKSILLITDGENHMSEDQSVYDLLKKKNILLYAMGIGSNTGGPVPDIANKTLKLNTEGDLIISKVNTGFVRKLAASCNGKVMMIDSSYPDPTSLLTEINLRSKGYFRNLKIEVRRTLIEYPLFVGFVFYILFLITPGIKFLQKNEK